VVDLDARGDLLQKANYDYSTLERVDLAGDVIVTCATHIWRSPDEFELHPPASHWADLSLRWRQCATGSGLLTVRCREEVASISLLASGVNPEGDFVTRQTLQTHLVRELHDTGSEPGFTLSDLPQRPLLATILLLPPATPSSRLGVALIDRCFAAAYFRYQGLV